MIYQEDQVAVFAGWLKFCWGRRGVDSPVLALLVVAFPQPKVASRSLGWLRNYFAVPQLEVAEGPLI